MTSNVDFSTPSATLLSMELDEITFSGLTAGERLAMEFTVSAGSTELDSWSATYYADNRGNIHLTALGRMWNRYFLAYRRLSGDEDSSPQNHPDMLTVEMSYTMEDDTTASCQRHLYYSRRNADVALSQLLYKMPLIVKNKVTVLGAKELAWVIPTVSSVTLKVVASYVLNNTMSSYQGNITWSGSSSSGGSADVSPSVIAALLPTGSKLVRYTAAIIHNGAESDICRFEVDHGATLRAEFFWLNRWGVYESLVMRGTETQSPVRSAQYGWAGEEWSALDLEVNDDLQVSTGYVGDREWLQMRDMAESPIVWLWDGAWHKVTVTDVKLDRTKPSNEARACMVTYRQADREAVFR